jgi:hypothetical protein
MTFPAPVTPTRDRLTSRRGGALDIAAEEGALLGDGSLDASPRSIQSAQVVVHWPRLDALDSRAQPLAAGAADRDNLTQTRPVTGRSLRSEG